MDFSSHKSLILNLCRVCGSHMKNKEKQFFVNCYLTVLKDVFWIHNIENDDPEVHPPKFCSKCYFAMKNVKKGHAHSQHVTKWEKHEMKTLCKICLSKCQNKPGRGRRPKPNLDGFNQHSETKSMWTRAFSDSLKEKIEESNVSEDLNISEFDTAYNKSLPLCKCGICENILRRPVMLQGCQHAFCLGCIILKFEGKTSFECPFCQNQFNLSQIIECKVRQKLIESLILKCKCGKEFKSSHEFNMHKNICNLVKEGQLMTVNDLLKMDLSQSPIPRSVEKAALKIIRHKIDESNNGTAEFASGGPRVCFFFKVRY